MSFYKDFNLQQNKKLFILSCIIVCILCLRVIYHIEHQAISVSFETSPEKQQNHIEDEEFTDNIQDYQINVVKGDKLVDILRNHKINNNEIEALFSSLKTAYNIHNIHEGQSINLTIENITHPKLISFEIELDPSHKIIAIHNDHNTFDAKTIKNLTYKQVVRVSQPIKDSLFSTAISTGISEHMVMSLVKLYNSYNINLNRDIRDGDKFEIIFEKFIDENGNFSHEGKIIYSSLTTKKNKILDIYRYTTQKDTESYFNSNGRYLVNLPLLQLPLDNIKVSSSFGERYHPIYKKVKLHKGVDLAAAVGTPVKSASDGTVEYIGNRGGYGKYMRIKHNKHYSTAYAHLSKFPNNLKVGSKVKTGEIIAYSGKTGQVTGPHLHYEVLYKNKQINPMKVSSLLKTISLEGEELKKFIEFTKKIQTALQKTTISESDIYNT